MAEKNAADTSGINPVSVVAKAVKKFNVRDIFKSHKDLIVGGLSVGALGGLAAGNPAILQRVGIATIASRLADRYLGGIGFNRSSQEWEQFNKDAQELLPAELKHLATDEMSKIMLVVVVRKIKNDKGKIIRQRVAYLSNCENLLSLNLYKTRINYMTLLEANEQGIALESHCSKVSLVDIAKTTRHQSGESGMYNESIAYIQNMITEAEADLEKIQAEASTRRQDHLENKRAQAEAEAAAIENIWQNKRDRKRQRAQQKHKAYKDKLNYKAEIKKIKAQAKLEDYENNKKLRAEREADRKTRAQKRREYIQKIYSMITAWFKRLPKSVRVIIKKSNKPKSNNPQEVGNPEAPKSDENVVLSLSEDGSIVDGAGAVEIGVAGEEPAAHLEVEHPTTPDESAPDKPKKSIRPVPGGAGRMVKKFLDRKNKEKEAGE